MIEELVKTEADRQLVNIIMSGAALSSPIATTPDVPEPRLRALRAAFLAVMKDPIRRGDRRSSTSRSIR